jgi:TonB family protein
MKIRNGFLGILLLVLFWNCGKSTPAEYAVFVDLTLFEIKGNGMTLNFPVFSRMIDIDEMVRNVDIADYYHRKLSRLYDFKDFTYVSNNEWAKVIRNADEVNDGIPIFSGIVADAYRNQYDAEVVFLEYRHPVGEFMFRIAKDVQGEKQVRHQKIELNSGQSASIGALYDETQNRGFLYVISMSSIEITPGLSAEEFIQFIEQKNSFGRKPEEKRFSNVDRQMIRALFGEEALAALPQAEKPPPDNKSVPYDTPPRPLTPIRPGYPETARKDSVEGAVILQVFVSEDGKTGEMVVLRSVREDLDQAAIEAIKPVEWEPARYKEQPVGVWINIPINFRLK